MKKVDEALTSITAQKAELPNTLRNLQQERDADAREAFRVKRKINPVGGSADADAKEMDEIEQIRLRAISTIQSLL